jgi:hypothetical protein
MRSGVKVAAGLGSVNVREFEAPRPGVSFDRRKGGGLSSPGCRQIHEEKPA